jgi:hypothetical protein
MAMYYFNIRDGVRLATDELGLDLTNLLELRAQLLIAMRGIIAGEATDRTFSASDDRVIEVSDEAGHVVMVVPFSAAYQAS